MISNVESQVFPFSEEFSGTNSVDGHIDLFASDELKTDHDNHFHTEFRDHIFNEGVHIPHNGNIHSNEVVIANIMVQER